MDVLRRGRPEVGQFRIDASSFGNVARWINHVPMVRDGDGPVQNLKAILSRDPASPNEHKWKVSFCAIRDIAPGEPLWGDLSQQEHSQVERLPPRGVLHPYEMCGDAETLGCAATRAPLRADQDAARRGAMADSEKANTIHIPPYDDLANPTCGKMRWASCSAR